MTEKIYEFNLNDRAFKAIQEGRKKVEIRVTKLREGFDYSILKSNDLIRFKNSHNKRIECKILKINWYKSIEELLTIEGTEYTLSSTNDFDEGVKSINSFDGYTEGMKKNGVFAIHLEYLGEYKYKLEELNCISDNINIDEYIKFRENVRARMEYPEWLGNISEDELKNMLDIGSKIWIYYEGDIPICSMMFIPSGELAKSDLEIEGIDYNLMGDIGPVFVNFDYLGNGLMMQMLKEFDSYLRSIGYKYEMTTVHPDNIFCSRNIMNHGLEKVNQKIFKRGIRNIYFKEL